MCIRDRLKVLYRICMQAISGQGRTHIIFCQKSRGWLGFMTRYIILHERNSPLGNQSLNWGESWVTNFSYTNFQILYTTVEQFWTNFLSAYTTRLVYTSEAYKCHCEVTICRRQCVSDTANCYCVLYSPLSSPYAVFLIGGGGNSYVGSKHVTDQKQLSDLYYPEETRRTLLKATPL